MKKYINKIIHDDALNFLSKLKSNSTDIILTDPPYFLDKMDNNWSAQKVKSPKKPYAIKHLPAGMKFNKEQGKEFYSWYLKISEEFFRILKPGGFFFSFSSPRLYHRMTCAMDDAGFEIRDCFIWLYTQNQPKAMSLHHFINKMDKSKKEKERLNKYFTGWKTPQVKILL
ncbi:MAG: DNA methyltransferase [Oligoflexia bacterium]|nr:DNA methyltransferase [Oligoflexia bacterium]